MPTTTAKRNVSKEIETAIRRIIADRSTDELTLSDLTDAVLESGCLDDETIQAIRAQAITRYVGHVLNRANIKTDDGRKVRAFQSYTKIVQDEGGEQIQQNVWKHVDDITKKQWLAVVAQRKKHVRDSWDSLIADNDYVCKKHGWKIQLHFI